MGLEFPSFRKFLALVMSNPVSVSVSLLSFWDSNHVDVKSPSFLYTSSLTFYSVFFFFLSLWVSFWIISSSLYLLTAFSISFIEFLISAFRFRVAVEVAGGGVCRGGIWKYLFQSDGIKPEETSTQWIRFVFHQIGLNLFYYTVNYEKGKIIVEK